MSQARSTSNRYSGVRMESVHRRRRTHHNSTVRPIDADDPRSNVFQSESSQKAAWSTSSRMINSTAENDENTFSTGVTSLKGNKAILEEETSSSSKSVKRSETPVSIDSNSNSSTNNNRGRQSKHADLFGKNNPTWKYILVVLYAVLGILFLTALILPSIFVYLLAPKSSETGSSELPTYRNHCAGISPNTLWQIYNTSVITMRVNTSECDFQEAPLYFVSVGGSSNHFCLTGYGAIYLPTEHSFEIYVQSTCGSTATSLMSYAASYNWTVNWMGFYK